MTHSRRPLILVLACAPFVAFGCGNRDTGAGPADPAAFDHDDDEDDRHHGTIPFADAEIYFEYNATADDAGIQVFLDAEPWKKVTIADGRGRELLEIETGGGMRRLGLTELRFEGAEPEPAETYDAFPPGEYRFGGRTTGRQRLTGSAFLSHDIPPAPMFAPSHGEVVDPDHVVITWDEIPGMDRYQVIVESDANGLVMEVSVSPSTTSLAVPPTFLEPNTEYKAEILAIAPSGNRTITEGTFVTGP